MKAAPTDVIKRAGTTVLRCMLDASRFEEIAPDLVALYEARRRSGARLATLRYLFDIASVVSRRSLRRRRSAWHEESKSVARGPIMFKNYLLVATRHLRKQKGFTFINAAGLGIGLACCLFILLYVRDELSYDRHHADANRIFRVTANYVESGGHWAPIGPPVGLEMQAEFPEIESLARFFPSESGVIFKRGDVQFEERNGGFADSTFFSFFTLPLLEGNPKTALSGPGKVVISERMALKYFGDESALGQSLTIVGIAEVTVSGVLKELPSTTHMPIDYLAPMESFYQGNEDWLAGAKTWAGFHTYIKLKNLAGRRGIEEKLPDFTDRFMEGRFSKVGSEVVRFELQPLTDIHLYSQLEKEYRPNGDIAYVYTFSLIAILILLVACINFVNLATARAAGRMREVAIRKTFGAHRQQLMRQYLGESMLLSALGLLLALGLIVALLPAFNSLTGKALELADVLSSQMIASLVLMTVIAGLIAGIYPAFVLSGFRPATALRGRGGSATGRALLRKGLVVFQFAISIFLIAGSVIIWQQLDFFRTKQLGFDKEHVLDVSLDSHMTETVTQNPETVKNELFKDPSIVSVSNASSRPGERYSLEVMTLDGRSNDEGTMMRIAWRTDHDYVTALGLDIVAGRDFSRAAPADTNAWLINEAAARRLELTNPVGQIMRWDDYAGPIVGVIRDFNFASLHSEIEPLVIPLRPGHGGRLLVRFASSEPKVVVSHVEETLQRLFPGSLFTVSFVGDSIDALYAGEDTLRDVLGYFSAIAILIACLGLFGLAAFMAEQRTKEIGIRKVLGASSRAIVSLLSRDFVLLVGIAFLISIPVTWIAASSWLENFAFRIDISPIVFAGTGMVAMLIAVLTVGYQATRAALADPIASIRHE
ncbi:MAG: ABC transporter permease [Bacteroidetes bacterium]|nr:ABC transporter permease [Bacteroidota bacterium]